MTFATPPACNVANAPRRLEFGNIQIDIAGIRAFCCGRAIDMGLREFWLLCFLVQHPNVVHSRAALLRAVWPPGTQIKLSTVDTYILRLRIALRGGCKMELIHTVRAKGYELSGAACGAQIVK